MLTPEDIDSLVEHPGFDALTVRIEEMIQAARNSLEVSRPIEQTEHERGRVAALRSVLGLPDVLRTEAEEAANARRSHR
jgi:hypothetical protein